MESLAARELRNCHYVKEIREEFIFFISVLFVLSGVTQTAVWAYTLFILLYHRVVWSHSSADYIKVQLVKHWLINERNRAALVPASDLALCHWKGLMVSTPFPLKAAIRAFHSGILLLLISCPRFFSCTTNVHFHNSLCPLRCNLCRLCGKQMLWEVWVFSITAVLLTHDWHVKTSLGLRAGFILIAALKQILSTLHQC